MLSIYFARSIFQQYHTIWPCFDDAECTEVVMTWCSSSIPDRYGPNTDKLSLSGEYGEVLRVLSSSWATALT